MAGIYDGPILDYPMEVLRGWPNDGSLDFNTTISAAATGASGMSCGNICGLDANGHAILTTATPTAPLGLVFRGNNDSASSVNAALVGERPGVSGAQGMIIWGNAIFRTTVYNAASSYAPGTAVTGINGVVDVATGTMAVLGYVMDVYPASGNQPASLMIVMH
jgi:hypothetical protein